MAPLQEQIQAINQRLRAFGIEAVQEIRMTVSVKSAASVFPRPDLS